MMRMSSRITTAALLVALILVAAPGFAADYVYSWGADVAALADDGNSPVVGATAIYDATSGAINNSYWRVRPDFFLWMEPSVLFGGASVTIDDIDQVTYTTRTGATTANLDVAFQMYTNPSSDTTLGGNDASWFQRLLKAEPLYFDDYDGNFPDDTWNTFDTEGATSPVRFYDGRGHTYAGFYGGPTLADVQGAGYSDLWSDFPSSGGDGTSYNYGNMTIKSFVLATNSTPTGYWAGFEGDLDQLYISLNNGDTATVNFDAVNPNAGSPSDNSPEPATWVLLACTGVAAVIRRRRAA